MYYRNFPFILQNGYSLRIGTRFRQIRILEELPSIIIEYRYVICTILSQIIFVLLEYSKTLHFVTIKDLRNMPHSRKSKRGRCGGPSL